MGTGIGPRTASSAACLLCVATLAAPAGVASTSPGSERRDVAPQQSSGSRQVDRDRNRVWALTEHGVSVHDLGRAGARVIALPGWQWVDVPHACPPALALGPQGEALITSNVVPTVWRVDALTLTVGVHPLALDADREKDLGYSAVVYSPRHEAYFALSDVHGSLWRIDRSLTQARKVTLPSRLPMACTLAAPSPVARRPQPRQPDLCLGKGAGSVYLNDRGDSGTVSSSPCPRSPTAALNSPPRWDFAP